MKNLKFLSIFNFIICILLLSSSSIAQEIKKHSYIGVEKCGMCHKTEKQGKQLDIWKNSKHSKAFEVLTTDKANEIAKQKGFDTPAAKTETCLKCHTTGSNVEATLKGEKFKVEDGVQCETCHGPGSDYKDMKIMKVKEESVKNGLIIQDNLEKFCTTCHNSESPTFTEFKLDEMWEKIKHPKTKN